MEVAGGEYIWEPHDLRELIPVLDVVQADVTRCGGITGLLQVAGLAATQQIDLSAHCAPAASAHAFCAVQRLRHLEYFHDHVRVESLLFDGTLSPEGGALTPDPSAPGLGLDLRVSDIGGFEVHRRTHDRKRG
jgi:L-alanine-DL-glutamate epimerase-like enolase superfamily enzyme